MSYLLEVEHVGKVYENFSLKDINFCLEEGTIMGLVGTNGAGKTTLIQIILGLLQKEGVVRIGGMDTQQYEKETKDLCGFVLDDNPFLNAMSAIGNARIFGPYYSGWDENKFRRYCKKFDVNIKKQLSKLSKGTVIKFQLAFALSHDARLFVFDEPSAGLDPIFRRELLDIMYDITMDEKRSVIFSTHLTNDLDRVADSITMLHKGEQLFMMQKEELFDRYLLVRGKEDRIDDLPEAVVVASKHMEHYSEALILKTGDPKYSDLETMQPSIEDIMIYLTQRRLKGENVNEL